MPTAAELGEYYATSYRFDYQLAGSKPPRFHLNRSRKLAQRRISTLSPFWEKGSAVLDFGCGSGEFLAACLAKECTAVGIEPGDSYAKYAAEEYGLKVHVAGWEDTDLGEQKFDLITAFHVFEHLRDPRAALLWLMQHLAPNGVIYLEVPDMTPKPKSRKLFEDLHFAHVHGFTPHSLAKLGEVCGLQVDPTLEPGRTGIAFRRPQKKPAKPAFDPSFSAALAKSFDKTDIVAHIFKGKWIPDAFRRLKKDVVDTFKTK